MSVAHGRSGGHTAAPPPPHRSAPPTGGGGEDAATGAVAPFLPAVVAAPSAPGRAGAGTIGRAPCAPPPRNHRRRPPCRRSSPPAAHARRLRCGWAGRRSRHGRFRSACPRRRRGALFRCPSRRHYRHRGQPQCWQNTCHRPHPLASPPHRADDCPIVGHCMIFARPVTRTVQPGCAPLQPAAPQPSRRRPAQAGGAPPSCGTTQTV